MVSAVLKAFGIGQEGLSDDKFLKALSSKGQFEARIRKIQNPTAEPETSLYDQVVSEGSYSLTSTGLTLARSVSNTFHNFLLKLSEKTQIRLELTKTVVIITLPLSAKHIYDDVYGKHPKKGTELVLHIGNHVSNALEATGMVLEAIYAYGKYTGRIVRIADVLGAVSTVAGSITAYSIDLIALYRLGNLEAKFGPKGELENVEEKYHAAFKNRLSAMKNGRYASMTATTVYFVAWVVFTKGAPHMIGVGWICMATGAAILLATKVYHARAVANFTKEVAAAA